MPACGSVATAGDASESGGAAFCDGSAPCGRSDVRDAVDGTARDFRRESSGPPERGGIVIGIALILAAVFIPVGLMSGIQGRLNQQFAITIAVSVLISAFNALTLSPALSASSAAR